MESGGSTTTTPVPTTETSPAAPATSAPSASSGSGQRPTSFQEAFEQVAAAQEQPASPPETAATGQEAPVDPNAVSHPSEKTGPIPFEVHKKALDNARVKAVEEAQAKWREQHGWAEQIKRDDVEAMAASFRELQSNPVGFLDRLARELAAHPTYGPQLRSHAGRTLASGRPEPEPQPDVQIVDAQGTVTGMTYSAKQLAVRDAWRERQLLAKVNRELQPIKQERAQREQASREAAAKQQVEAATDSVLADVMDILDGDKALFAEVNTVMAQHPEWSAHKAALEVRKARIVPTLESKAQQKALDTINRKAAGNTANGAGVSVTPKRPTNAKELAAWMEANAR